MQNQFHTHPADSQKQHSLQQSLGQSLQLSYRAIANFMVHRPQVSVQSSLISPAERYSTKASLYPYLPIEEEQRDWLEQIYAS